MAQTEDVRINLQYLASTYGIETLAAWRFEHVDGRTTLVLTPLVERKS